MDVGIPSLEFGNSLEVGTWGFGASRLTRPSDFRSLASDLWSDQPALLGILAQRMGRRQLTQQFLLKLGRSFLLRIIAPGALVQMPRAWNLRVLQRIRPASKLAGARNSAID